MLNFLLLSHNNIFLINLSNFYSMLLYIMKKSIQMIIKILILNILNLILNHVGFNLIYQDLFYVHFLNYY